METQQDTPSWPPLLTEEDIANLPVDPEEANIFVSGEVSSWKGVRTREHMMGGIEFWLEEQSLGHLHDPPGDVATADLEFPKPFRDDLVAAGRARNHITDKQGKTDWVTVPIGTVAEVAFTIRLFEYRYKQGMESNLNKPEN